MLKVLTAEQMREVDRLTTERYGIPSIILMENAAHAVARVITEKLGGSVKGKSILVLCGKGNNGGDGAALARILWQAGAQVFVLLAGRLSTTQGDAKLNFKIFEKIDEDVLTSAGEFNKSRLEEQNEYLPQHLQDFLSEGKTDVYVDALFGTGLTKPLAGYLADTVQRLELLSPLTVSIDIPSGLNADSGETIGPSVRANVTVTFTSPKLANVLTPAANKNGCLTMADIGTPRELIDEQPSRTFVSEKNDAAFWFRASAFSNDSYKNKRGHALIFAGSEDYAGAAVMCGNAAMRSGVGLTTLLVPASCKVEVASRVIPEIIVKTLGETDGEVSGDAFATNAEEIRQADSILIGPGLKATDKGVEKLVREIVRNHKVPVVVDAGALWFFNPPDGLLHKPAREQGRIAHAADEANGTSAEIALADARAFALVLTPHEGEFLRLLGTENKEVIKDRVAAVRDYAAANGVILVLKGERVLIGSPDGRVVVNPTGNSGLGKAGNGDTLAGIIAGFVAQAVKFEIDVFETVVAAVYVAGMAGDVAEKKFGKRAMTASDVRECLVDVFEELEKKGAV